MTDPADSRKAFAAIRDDYAFFQQHGTEAQRDIEAYLPHLAVLRHRGRANRFLDFGCGDGWLTEQLLRAAELGPHELAISLVEPDDVYRAQAAVRLQPFSAMPIVTGPTLIGGAPFDLALSNHVLYYVADLRATVDRLLGSLAAGGRLLATMAGPRNPLIQCWHYCFKLAGKEVPYYDASDLDAVLAERGRPLAKEDVVWELAFADSGENRQKVLRFLLGGHFHDLPLDPMLRFFDAYAAGGRIRMRNLDELFVIPA